MRRISRVIEWDLAAFCLIFLTNISGDIFARIVEVFVHLTRYCVSTLIKVRCVAVASDMSDAVFRRTSLPSYGVQTSDL